MKPFCSLLFLVLFSGIVHAQKWELMWSEEFDQETPDFEVWDPWVGTAFNNELQFYTNRPENIFIEDGILNLQARRERFSGQNFTSARVESKGSFFFKFGKVEARIKLPFGKGLWPAFWMMPEFSRFGIWPRSGEIDIMEFRGNEVDNIVTTAHFWNGSRREFFTEETEFFNADFTQDFHLYQLEWEENEMRWYVDNRLVHTLRPELIPNASPYPFNEEFFFILNVAVGGDFLENPDASTQFPVAMEVDYIRVYQDVNAKPQITLADSEIRVETGQPLRFLPLVSDSDGQLDTIRVFLDDRLWVEQVEPTNSFDFTWERALEGCYELKVEAIDNDRGRTVRTAPLRVGGDQACQKSPFSGEPKPLPALISAVEFDNGSQSKGFFDTDPFKNKLDEGATSVPRPSLGMETEFFGDETALLSEMEADEWVEYTVEVPRNALYEIEVRGVRVNREAQLRFISNDEILGRIIRFPTNDEKGTTTAKTGTFELKSGIHVIRMEPIRGSVKVASLDFIELTVTNNEILDPQKPTSFSLRAWPNPFNPETTVEVRLDLSQNVNIALYDLSGRQIREVFSGVRSAGAHQFRIDALGLASGVYVIKVAGESQTLTQKVTLVK